MYADQPLVSIIVNNYNYEQYVGSAIESALAQSYPRIEVIVVDDGSTDGSRAVVQSYGDRVVAVFKANGGQASAFNAGFTQSHGDIVIFLDADDLLLSWTVKQVVEAFLADPTLVKIQYRLAVVDENGNDTREVIPPIARKMPNGDLSRLVMAFPDDILWQPTSGNAFIAWALHSIFPMPEAEYRICADYYLSNLPPLLGSVRSLEEICGGYRIHSANNHARSNLDLDRTRALIVRTMYTHMQIGRLAATLGYSAQAVNKIGVYSVTFWAHRLISLKLAPNSHPLPQDSLRQLLHQGMQAAWGRFDLPPRRRLLYALWFLLLCIVPRPLVKQLAKPLI